MERSKVFVIAEIGSAWRFRDLKTHLAHAMEAIEVAKSANADCVKFQYCSDPRTMEQRRKVPEGSYEILAWPKAWLAVIAEECRLQDIEFLCTVFLRQDVDTLNPYVKRWKVASLESGDRKIIEAMLRTDKLIIASYGCTGDVGERWANEQCKSLHCTAAYPAPLESLNLNAIQVNSYDGYSDHSRNVLTGAIAVACGASIVETHFKLPDTSPDNPDYGHSLWPEQLADYISNIRDAELMLGDGVKRVMPCEEWALKHKVKT